MSSKVKSSVHSSKRHAIYKWHFIESQTKKIKKSRVAAHKVYIYLLSQCDHSSIGQYRFKHKCQISWIKWDRNSLYSLYRFNGECKWWYSRYWFTKILSGRLGLVESVKIKQLRTCTKKAPSQESNRCLPRQEHSWNKKQYDSPRQIKWGVSAAAKSLNASK